MPDTLSDTTIQDAIRDLLVEATSNGTEDVFLVRRRWQRHSHDARLEWRRDGDVMPAILADISAGGMAFWVREKLAEGTEIAVRRWPGNDETWIPGTVRHCVQGLKGWRVGVRFPEPVEFAATKPAVEPPPEPDRTPPPKPKARWGLLLMLLVLFGGSAWWLGNALTRVG